MPPRDNSLKRRVRSLGGRVLRRYGLLPGGTPDGLGDDDRLAEAILDGDAVLFFADTADSLYQLRGWYGPLVELHRARGLTIVCMDSRVARTIRGDIEVPVVTIARDATLDGLIDRSGTRLLLYVNYNPLNTIALRTRSAIHISLLHGDSDKGVSVSNQVKAYDFSFVAGQAAVDRFTRYTALFDAASRCLPVGRPGLDTDPAPAPTERPADGHPVVLYAPTWEGGHASVAYSSLPTHGTTLVRSLMDAGLHVIYRPHPLTGVRLADHGEADAELRRLLEPTRHRVSEGRSLAEDFAAADLLVCDVSAVANDWLATGKPLLVTEPAAPSTRDAGTELLRVVPRLPVGDAHRTGLLALAQISDDPTRERRRALTEYYLGDTRAGASLARFLQACQELAELRDRQWARIRAHEEDERSSRA